MSIKPFYEGNKPYTIQYKSVRHICAAKREKKQIHKTSFIQVYHLLAFSSIHQIAMENSNPMSGSSKGKKMDTKRRSWTSKEEQVLIKELHALVNKGWKSDNGFRPGYLQQLETGLNKAFPNTDLKAEPHINSKITVWKRQQSTLITLLSKSGIEWNEKDKMITVNIEDVYEQHCKVDKEARKVRFKSFPFLEDWNIIFGKDRATGEWAEDIQEAVNHTQRVQALLNGVQVDSGELPLHMEIDDAETEEISRSSSNHPKRKGKMRYDGAKRSKSGEVEMQPNALEILRQFSEGTQEKLAIMVKNMSYEVELAKKKDAIYNELGKIGWIELNDRIKVSNYLCNNQNALQLIFSLPDDARESMVRMILQGELH